MAIVKLFSQKQKKLTEGNIDIFEYESIPQKVKVQIYHIIKDTIGEGYLYDGNSYIQEIYKSIYGILIREYGLIQLPTFNIKYENEYEVALLNFFLNEKDVNNCLDVIQLFFEKFYFWSNNRYVYNDHLERSTIGLTVYDAIDELNYRLREGAIGYQFENGEIIRVDSTYIHSEVVIPTLNLLRNFKFEGANEEFLKAHEHYRHKRNKECLTDCLKAFESVLKIICKEKGWEYKETDTSSKLIQLCFDNELVPTFTQNQFTSLKNLLESGIPPIRNKRSGHGQGQTPQTVSEEITRYGLNLTGTCIIFLIEQSGII